MSHQYKYIKTTEMKTSLDLGRLSIGLLTLKDFYTDVAFFTPYVGFFCLSELVVGLQSSQVLMALWCCVEPSILQSMQTLWQWERHHVASFTHSLFKSREKKISKKTFSVFYWSTLEKKPWKLSQKALVRWKIFFNIYMPNLMWISLNWSL